MTSAYEGTGLRKRRIRKLRRMRTGMYRFAFSRGEFFGQVRQCEDRLWKAEVRRCESGELVRHAGLWNKMWEAIEELVAIENASHL